MSYLIAVATSDAKVVDLGFGAAMGFHIYEVEGTEYKEKEYRERIQNSYLSSLQTILNE